MNDDQKDLSSKTLTGIFAGSATAVFPNLNLMTAPDGSPAFVTWDFAVWITSIKLSTTLTIFPTGAAFPSDLGGIIVTLGKQPTSGISIGTGLESQDVHITSPNSVVGPPVVRQPSSKISHAPYPGRGRFVAPGEPVSLYAFANVSATGNELAAIASIFYRRANNC